MKNVYMMKYYIKHSMGCIPTKADLKKMLIEEAGCRAIDYNIIYINFKNAQLIFFHGTNI